MSIIQKSAASILNVLEYEMFVENVENSLNFGIYDVFSTITNKTTNK